MNPVLEEISISDYERERGKPMPSYHHGIVQSRLCSQWDQPGFVAPSELTLEMSELPNLTPDICVFPNHKTDWQHDEIRKPEPPLTVVEILSPTQGSFELMQRIDRYFSHGVNTCWIVYPTSKSITIYEQGKEAVTISQSGKVTDPCTGLEADLDRLFA